MVTGSGLPCSVCHCCCGCQAGATLEPYTERQGVCSEGREERGGVEQRGVGHGVGWCCMARHSMTRRHMMWHAVGWGRVGWRGAVVRGAAWWRVMQHGHQEQHGYWLVPGSSAIAAGRAPRGAAAMARLVQPMKLSGVYVGSSEAAARVTLVSRVTLASRFASARSGPESTARSAPSSHRHRSTARGRPSSATPSPSRPTSPSQS